VLLQAANRRATLKKGKSFFIFILLILIIPYTDFMGYETIIWHKGFMQVC
jgi:hypothetical protein